MNENEQALARRILELIKYKVPDAADGYCVDIRLSAGGVSITAHRQNDEQHSLAAILNIKRGKA